MSDAGFLVDGTLYPFAENLTFMDAPLVYAVTGLEFDEFAERVDILTGQSKDAKKSKDFLAVTGLLAIAVSRAEPDWGRDRIVRFLSTADISSFDVQAPEGDAGPPEQKSRETAASPGSSDASTTSQEDLPEGAPV